jgi:hypothetical protein
MCKVVFLKLIVFIGLVVGTAARAQASWPATQLVPEPMVKSIAKIPSPSGHLPPMEIFRSGKEICSWFDGPGSSPLAEVRFILPLSASKSIIGRLRRETDGTGIMKLKNLQLKVHGAGLQGKRHARVEAGKDCLSIDVRDLNKDGVRDLQISGLAKTQSPGIVVEDSILARYYYDMNQNLFRKDKISKASAIQVRR